MSRRRATRESPCPVCEHTDGACSVGDDGLIFCMRRTGQQTGFAYLGQAKNDPQWALYRPEGNSCQGGPQSQTNNGRADKAASRDWGAIAKRCQERLGPNERQQLADHLGLPEHVLAALGVGWGHDEQGDFWTFPQVDGIGRVVGITRRYHDGGKKEMANGRRGLYVPAGVFDRLGDPNVPLICPEGASNTLALTAIGLPAVGRPSCSAGTEELSRFLAQLPRDKAGHVIILGDIDPKQDGRWPGRDGAAATAARLSERLQHVTVAYALPPDGCKDVRAWVLSRNLDKTCPSRWHETGSVFLQAMQGKGLRPGLNGHRGQTNDQANGHAANGKPRLATTCLTGIRPRPVRWLVSGYIALGKLTLIAGDGGHGKSSLTLDLAANLTRGRCCLGLNYEPLPPCDVLLISCEDDFGDTVVPRSLAAGADLGRIYRVDGIEGKDSKPVPFTLASFEAMEVELEQRPNVRLVVVDPAGAYIGRSGVDDHKDSELRSLLGPLAEVAARRNVAIILIKHLVKGVTAKAVHKVSGSTGYVNTVRAAFVVAPDLDDPARKLLLPLKFNLGAMPGGLSYRLESLTTPDAFEIAETFTHLDEQDRDRIGAQLFRVQWLGGTNADADTVLGEAARRERGGASRVQEAAAWLEEFLAEYAYPSKEIFEAGLAAGFAKDNIYKAKDRLGKDRIRARKLSFDGEWWWGLGVPEDWKRRPKSEVP